MDALPVMAQPSKVVYDYQLMYGTTVSYFGETPLQTVTYTTHLRKENIKVIKTIILD